MDVSKGFNKQNLKEFRETINKALAEIHPDVTFEIGNISFSQGRFSTKLEATLNGENGINDNDPAYQYMLMMGKTLSVDVTQEVNIPNYGVCKIIKYNLRAPKNPWIVKTAKGEYRFPDVLVKGHWPKLAA